MEEEIPSQDLSNDSLIESIGERAQRALRDRPSFSIRMRLTLGFTTWLVVSVGITIFAIIVISSIREKLLFMEATQSYAFEIQQARRFEKNYLLYGTNFDDTLEHIHKARHVLENEGDNMVIVIGHEGLENMEKHLMRYEEILIALHEMKKGDELESPRYREFESDLREHGSKMVTLAQRLLEKERRSINSMILTSQRIPIISLGVLLILIIYLALFIGRQMLAPLNRIMQATQRIAEGDFTPITPKRRYHDEFSELAIAMNHMMQQLVQRHDMLVQAHKLKSVGTLTAGIAHELNNPINNIILTASALQEEYNDLDDEEREDMLKDLIGESERAQKIVRNLLDFAREREMESETINMQDMIEETLRLASNQIKFAKVKVTGELQADLPPVFGDRQQLGQVFLNLILNALDAMPGGGTLMISLRNTKDREFVAIDFADTGIGIPQQKIGEIFDPFYTSKKKGKGTGLGLSVSLGIVQKHGGDIKIKSKIDKGSTFTVLLPAAKVPADYTSPAERSVDDEEIG